jgi:hypothetical protein
MQDLHSHAFSSWIVVIPITLVLLGILALYLVLLVRAIIDMLRYDTHSVLLTFAFLALVPLPPIVVMGVMVLIIWHFHKKDILARQTQEL